MVRCVRPLSPELTIELTSHSGATCINTIRFSCGTVVEVFEDKDGFWWCVAVHGGLRSSQDAAETRSQTWTRGEGKVTTSTYSSCQSIWLPEQTAAQAQASSGAKRSAFSFTGSDQTSLSSLDVQSLLEGTSVAAQKNAVDGSSTSARRDQGVVSNAV